MSDTFLTLGLVEKLEIKTTAEGGSLFIQLIFTKPNGFKRVVEYEQAKEPT